MELKLKLNQGLNLILTTEMRLSLEILEMPVNKLLDFFEKNINPELQFFTEKRESQSSLMENIDIEKEKKLTDYLEEQLNYEKIEKEEKNIIYFFINNLNEKGYLIESKEQLFKRLEVKREVFNKALKIFQKFEPKGVGAENLIECLLIQGEKYNSESLNIIIKNHLEDIAKKDYEKISRETKMSKSEIYKYVGYIKEMNPKPSRGYAKNEKKLYINPDIFLKVKENYLEIQVNKENFPKIKMDKKNLTKNEILKIIYITKAIEKREKTLFKISSYILNYQKENILKNLPLKTLKIKDIAKILDIHESTVSRALKDKYVKIDNGRIIKLRNFLTINSERERIKKIICDIIENEDKERPFSDIELTIYLKKKNIDIQRRTIAKYREELGILSSKKRKRRDINE